MPVAMRGRGLQRTEGESGQEVHHCQRVLNCGS